MKSVWGGAFGKNDSHDLHEHGQVLVVLDGPWHRQVVGGITRTVTNMVSFLESDYGFRILSWSGEDPSPNARRCLRFVQGRLLLWWRILNGMALRKCDVIYFNGIFSGALLAGLLGHRFVWKEKPVFVVAPRGHLMPAALQKSHWRKRLFLYILMRVLDLGSMPVRWHVTSNLEKAALAKVCDDFNECLVVPNLPSKTLIAKTGRSIPKIAGQARFVFVGDLIPHKGADFALRALCGVKGRVQLDLIGASKNGAFARALGNLAQNLRSAPSKSVVFHGFLSTGETFRIIENSHFLILPSRSENHGHVISEALGLSRPVLISDRTPWQGVSDTHAGFVATYGDVGCWQDRLRRIIEMDQGTFDLFSRNARSFFDSYLKESASAPYSALFRPANSPK